MYKNELIYFGMSTGNLREKKSNSVTHIDGMCLMSLKAGQICGMINTLFSIHQFLVFFPAQLLQKFQALDQPRNLGEMCITSNQTNAHI